MEEAFIREKHDSQEDWLEAKYAPRKDFRISATEAAAVLGMSPWRNSAELYDEKLGIAPRKDISDKSYVRYGIAMEPNIRAAAMLDLPYFRLEYHAYDILVSKKHPFMSCTLDGELEIEADDNPWMLSRGARGILECKTGSFRSDRALEEWEEFMPIHYYVQILHCLAVTGYDFAICAGRLKRDAFKDSDLGCPEIRNFYRVIDRRAEAVRGSIGELISAEEEFIKENLEKGIRPDVGIRL